MPKDDKESAPSTLPPFSNKRAADMFSYSNNNGNLEFGSGGDDADNTAAAQSGDAPAGGTTSLADISDGAKRLAQELDQYITRGPEKSGQGDNDKGMALSDDAIADLQLATARKLREVGGMAYFGFLFSNFPHKSLCCI